MTVPLFHHYHLFVPSGAEKQSTAIWCEHVAALDTSGLGSRLARMETTVVGVAIDLPSPPCHHQVVSFHAGHESLTLERMWASLDSVPTDACFLYCHSKGVTKRPGSPDAILCTHWRRAMLEHVVHGWRHSLSHLISGSSDVSGPFYLEPDRWLHRQPHFGRTPYFAGNFWWATARHLRRLPPPAVDGDRYLAETWVGLVPHTAYSRSRNVWPSTSRCRWSRIREAITNRLRPILTP